MSIEPDLFAPWSTLRKAAVYGDTVLEIGVVDRLRVHVRSELPEGIRDQLGQRGLSAPFAIITACNPRGRHPSDTENELRTAALAEALTGLGASVVPAVGGSPDGAHREPGFAAALPLWDAFYVALRFEQDAFFWFDGEGFWLVGAADPTLHTPLPLTWSLRSGAKQPDWPCRGACPR